MDHRPSPGTNVHCAGVSPAVSAPVVGTITGLLNATICPPNTPAGREPAEKEPAPEKGSAEEGASEGSAAPGEGAEAPAPEEAPAPAPEEAPSP